MRLIKVKKPRLNKRAIHNLNIDQEDVLVKDESGVISGGSDNTIPVDVGTTRHPKYC